MIAQSSDLDIRSSKLAVRRGFTLVELMVVVAIIGLLAGFITAAAIGAINKAREASISGEINSLTIAVESYKQKYGSYPPNLQDLPAVKQHLLKLFPRCKDPIPTTATGSNTLLRLSGISGTTTNYQLAGSTVPAGWWERTAAIHCLYFWLSGFYPDPEHPLSPPQTSASTATVPVYVANAQRVSFFDFNVGRLRPTGIAYNPSNLAPAGINLSQTVMLYAYFPAGLDTPYVYFNSGRYDPRDLNPLAAYSYPALNPDGSLIVDANGKLTPVHLRYARLHDTLSGGTDDLVLMTFPLRSAGIDPEYTSTLFQFRTSSVALPYRTTPVNDIQSYVNPNSFQIICAGMDNMYSGILSGQRHLENDGMWETSTFAAPAADKITRGNLYSVYFPGGMWWYPKGPEARQSTITSETLMRGTKEHRDNLTNFARTRLEQEIP